jgi:hypothetical protein
VSAGERAGLKREKPKNATEYRFKDGGDSWFSANSRPFVTCAARRRKRGPSGPAAAIVADILFCFEARCSGCSAAAAPCVEVERSVVPPHPQQANACDATSMRLAQNARHCCMGVSRG